MHGDPRYFAGNVPPAHPYEVGGYTYNIYTNGVPTFTFGAAQPGRKYEIPGTFSRFKHQLSETCPKNFIFDQMDNTNRVMSHPALVHEFGSSNIHVGAACVEEYGKIIGRNTDIKEECSSSFKEDTEDINALLSSEEENDEDDDVISTGRTPVYNQDDNFPDSPCFMEDLGCHTLGNASGHKSTLNSADRKRDRMKKMVEALRGIIPGGDQMDTTVVLDEAVRYLKSLKSEVEKLGIQELDD